MDHWVSLATFVVMLVVLLLQVGSRYGMGGSRLKTLERNLDKIDRVLAPLEGFAKWQADVDHKTAAINGLGEWRKNVDANYVALYARVEHIHQERKKACELEADQRVAIVERNDRIFARGDDLRHLARRLERLEDARGGGA
jgi:hypothetical protein